MNKNLFIYSFKYLAVLLALVTFSSCERDEFSEQDAFDLQQAQLNAQDAREQAALAAQDKRVMDMAMFRRSMDSLTRLNSGGKVFYTVNVVPGGSSAFSQGGRFEEVEGLDGATVTVSQLGGAVVEQKVTVAGLASFEMYSGEVTVNVEAPNHTDLNYTANLTPDGGVPNGSLIYVGNVVPVFDDPNNPGAGSEENLATVKGFAFAELDITGGNNFEESVPDGTKVRAFIDINPAFIAKYITQANDENVNTGGQPTMSGFIQRFAYEEAASTTGVTVTSPLNNDTAPDGGEYSISIGATASGLPITMKFDDFAADRTYYFGDLFGFPFFNGNEDGDISITPGTKRFIYTQNTQNATNTPTGGVANQDPTILPFQGAVDLAGFSNINFDFATTEATATADITGGTSIKTVTGPAVEIGGVQYNQYLVTGTAFTGGAVTSDGRVNGFAVDFANADLVYLGDAKRGSYMQTPTVVFPVPTDAAGVQATGVAVLGDRNTAKAGLTTDAGTLGTGTENDLRPVVAVLVTNAGSGYTDVSTTSVDDIIVKFERPSFTGKDAAGVPIANGIGTIISTLSGIGYVEIIDGGYGYTAANGSGPAGSSTGINPTALFRNIATDDFGDVPSGGTAPTANVVVDRTVGTVTQVDITNAGAGYTSPEVSIVNGITAFLEDGQRNVPQIDGNDATVFFETDGFGGLRFTNGGNNITEVYPANAPSLDDIDGILFQQPATKYALVPTVTPDLTGVTIEYDGATPNPAANTITLPKMEAIVDVDGNVLSIRIGDPGTGFAPNAITPTGTRVTGISVTVKAIPPRATATPFLSTGGGVSNYVINTTLPTTTYSTTVNRSAAAGGPGGAFTFLTSRINGGGNQIIVARKNGAVVNNNINALSPSDYSDYRVVFAAPVAGGLAASGYPIFEEDGSELVGVYITSQGTGYATTERPNFWIIPNDLSWAEYADGKVAAANNAAIKASLSDTRLTITFNTSGSGYAIRPEFMLVGGNKSVEDLAGINSGINAAVRGQLNFNGAGSITNTSINYTGALPFTAADLAAEPVSVMISTDRLAGIFTAEANGAGGNNFEGFISAAAAGNGTDYDTEFEYDFDPINGGVANINPGTALNFFNTLESSTAFTNADRVGTGGVNPPAAEGFRYITPPTFTIDFLGADTGTVGVASLNASANITALNMTTVGSLPGGFVFDSFIYGGNDTSYNPAGERFRTIGGPSNFEVFSGLTYIRDVNYGTGIELE